MSLLRCLPLSAVLAHLFLVCWNALQLPSLVDETPAGQVLGIYQDASGSVHNFCFFAPGVTGERRVSCVLVDADGNTWEDSLYIPGRHEVNLHVRTTMAHVDLPDVRQKIVSSFAALMFGRHASAVEVTVLVEDRDLPPLAEANANDIPGWITVYEATFSRASESQPED